MLVKDEIEHGVVQEITSLNLGTVYSNREDKTDLNIIGTQEALMRELVNAWIWEIRGKSEVDDDYQLKAISTVTRSN